MHILITGAAGMIGRKLIDRLSSGGLPNSDEAVDFTLFDVVKAPVPQSSSGTIKVVTGDITAPETTINLVAGRPDIIIHLAAAVSGDAEGNFENGYRVNLDGTRCLFDTIRVESERLEYTPRMVFASSLAVFGAPLPNKIPDTYHLTPRTSYGVQKAVGEHLLADYTRRGIFDGIGIRLPTICVRPGNPNKAASSFFSSILREPLIGQEAILPVATTVRHWFASPRAAVDFLVHAATLPSSKLGPYRNITMPGLSATIQDQIEALKRFAGDRAASLICHEPDPVIERIISSWPENFDASEALRLGFRAEASFDEIIRAHVEDELSGKLEARKPCC
ncbi:D-erythronate dehydrogenase [Labrenzia sp. DG1229]|uniref:D-erythronate dehydrogenase n=1 Tax=Labrenzia sp. DG1229 TaxID=681847 RepID=UPI00048B4612|nr:D-erythronate dehydrogenase [Labrenzia sp. DG1229]